MKTIRQSLLLALLFFTLHTSEVPFEPYIDDTLQIPAYLLCLAGSKTTREKLDEEYLRHSFRKDKTIYVVEGSTRRIWDGECANYGELEEYKKSQSEPTKRLKQKYAKKKGKKAKKKKRTSVASDSAEEDEFDEIPEEQEDDKSALPPQRSLFPQAPLEAHVDLSCVDLSWTDGLEEALFT